MGRDSTTSLEAVAGAIYDLRDHAYDNPALWERVSAVSVLEVMGQTMDRAIDADEEIDWTSFTKVVRDRLLVEPEPAEASTDSHLRRRRGWVHRLLHGDSRRKR